MNRRPDGIGAPLRRLEDRRLITGDGRYVDDIAIEGTLHAAFVRSTEAHAVVRQVHTSDVERLPGVVGVFLAADLGVDRPMPNNHPHPLLAESRQASPLATDEVCYAGQPVAVVVARDRVTAADAAELVWVDYDPLPAVAEVDAAREPDAPPVHAGASNNLVATLRSQYGDVEAIFSRADVVLPLELRQHRGACASMEPRGVMASPGEVNELTVWSSTQAPYPVARRLEEYLGQSGIRVIAPDVGGGFGPKAGVYAEEYVVSALSRHLGAPVKWIETRREHFVVTHQQRDLNASIEVAATATGKLLGLRGLLVHDNGAYVPYGLLLPLTCLQLVQGPYPWEAMDVALDVVYTNAVPTSPIRGAGRPNATFITERAVDAVARHLGIDRAEIRRQNLIRPESFPFEFPIAARYGGRITYDSGDYHAALDRVLELADAAGFAARQSAARQAGRRLGLGIASYVEDTGLGPFENAQVGLGPDGRVIVQVGTGSQGQGHATVLAQICATHLGVAASAVEVRAGDTALGGTGVATVASRTAVTAGASTDGAARELADRIKHLAAARLEAAEHDLVLEDGYVRVAGQPGSGVSFADLAAGVEDGILSVDHAVATPHPPYAFGCHVAEVEVDDETGLVTVLNYSVAHDCGTILNPMIVDGQIDGGVAHGLSNALLERVVYSQEGQPLATTFMDFRIPTALDMPKLAKVHTVTPSPDNPLGVKGAGEGGTIPAMAAVASAVEDALADLGVTIDRYPLLPSVVYQLIAASSDNGAGEENR